MPPEICERARRKFRLAAYHRRVTSRHVETERRARAALDEGDARAAATAAIQGYGPEILGFLRARLRDDTTAGDAFAVFCEDLWKGLPKFEARSTMRVWAYTLARHAADRVAGRARRERDRRASLSEARSLAEEVRTSTMAHQRTANKDRVRKLRARLTGEEETILILRVDKQLSWREIVQVLGSDDPDASDAGLARAAARLRKRYQAMTAKLRRLAEAEGLLPPS